MSHGACRVIDCGRPAERGDLCSTHRKRAQRGQRLDAPVRPYAETWRARVTGAALAVANADDDQGFERALWRFMRCLVRHYRHR